MPYDFIPGFLVKPVRRSIQNHWLGGPAIHRGADCQICDRPLLLLWDLDCTDFRFTKQGRPAFKSLERLPLYYCWTCAGELDYRVIGPDRLVVLRSAGSPQGADFPYRRYPEHFERRPIQLDLLADIPKETKSLIKKNNFSRIKPEAKKPIENWLGHGVQFDFDIWWHQFGGVPWLAQGPERILCANRKCSWHRRRWAMKVLASIINDPPGGLPIIESAPEIKEKKGSFNTWVQFVFHICPGCFSVHAANRCD